MPIPCLFSPLIYRAYYTCQLGSLTFRISAFCTRTVCVCFIWSSELNSVSLLFFDALRCLCGRREIFKYYFHMLGFPYMYGGLLARSLCIFDRSGGQPNVSHSSSDFPDLRVNFPCTPPNYKTSVKVIRQPFQP
jgi:hypothetical protein